MWPTCVCRVVSATPTRPSVNRMYISIINQLEVIDSSKPIASVREKLMSLISLHGRMAPLLPSDRSAAMADGNSTGANGPEVKQGNTLLPI